MTLSGSTLYGMTQAGGTGFGNTGYGNIFSIPVTGGAPTNLLSFNGTNGDAPDGSLTLSARINTLWNDLLRRGKRRRHHFQHPSDRRHSHDPGLVQRHERLKPYGSLTLSGSTLYGMTAEGGANSEGTIFSIPVTGGTPTDLLISTARTATALWQFDAQCRWINTLWDDLPRRGKTTMAPFSAFP